MSLLLFMAILTVIQQQGMLVTLKLLGLMTTPWIWVLSPSWIGISMIFISHIGNTLLGVYNHGEDK